MDTFNEVSRYGQILDRILGIMLLLTGITIGVFLIPDFLPLLKRTPFLLLEPDAGIRYDLGYAWFMQSVGWIIAFFAFRSGRAFLRDSKKQTSTNK